MLAASTSSHRAAPLVYCPKLIIAPLGSIQYRPSMITTLFNKGRTQAVRIPNEFRFEGKEVSIRRLGDGVLLLPIKASTWPEGFFESIWVNDDHFARPDQGELPTPSPC